MDYKNLSRRSSVSIGELISQNSFHSSTNNLNHTFDLKSTKKVTDNQQHPLYPSTHSISYHDRKKQEQQHSSQVHRQPSYSSSTTNIISYFDSKTHYNNNNVHILSSPEFIPNESRSNQPNNQTLTPPTLSHSPNSPNSINSHQFQEKLDPSDPQLNDYSQNFNYLPQSNTTTLVHRHSRLNPARRHSSHDHPYPFIYFKDRYSGMATHSQAPTTNTTVVPPSDAIGHAGTTTVTSPAMAPPPANHSPHSQNQHFPYPSTFINYSMTQTVILEEGGEEVDDDEQEDEGEREDDHSLSDRTYHGSKHRERYHNTDEINRFKSIDQSNYKSSFSSFISEDTLSSSLTSHIKPAHSIAVRPLDNQQAIYSSAMTPSVTPGLTKNGKKAKPRNFHCLVPGCNKSFTCSGHLIRHERMHSGERPFACLYPGCHSRFSRHDNMIQHYKNHLKKMGGASDNVSQTNPKQNGTSLNNPIDGNCDLLNRSGESSPTSHSQSQLGPKDVLNLKHSKVETQLNWDNSFEDEDTNPPSSSFSFSSRIPNPDEPNTESSIFFRDEKINNRYPSLTSTLLPPPHYVSATSSSMTKTTPFTAPSPSHREEPEYQKQRSENIFRPSTISESNRKGNVVDGIQSTTINSGFKLSQSDSTPSMDVYVDYKSTTSGRGSLLPSRKASEMSLVSFALQSSLSLLDKRKSSSKVPSFNQLVESIQNSKNNSLEFSQLSSTDLYLQKP